jgi:endonuclease/exonuclease/phosphatase family metal-dependent hydrolase
VIRAATWNLHRLGDPAAGRDEADIAALGAVLGALDADVLALQEVAEAAALDALLEAVPGPRRYAWAFEGRPAGLWDDAQGVALAWDCRRPPVAIEAVPGPPRRALAGLFDGIWFASAHLVAGWPDPDDVGAARYRREQARSLEAWGRGRSGVLMGDFNAQRPAEEQDSLGPLLALRWTWPPLEPDPRGGGAATLWTRGRAMDHVLWSPDLSARSALAIHAFDAGAAVDPVRTSDHRPVVVTLARTTRAPPQCRPS